MGRPAVSQETIEQFKKEGKVEIVGLFPVDRFNCPCQEIKATDFEKGIRKFIDCPKAKELGYKLYQVFCNQCGELQGYCYAKDEILKDYCDFHYIQWVEKNKKKYEWHGCFTPHLSPIDYKLCLECSCGNDTRDFRANTTLPFKDAQRLEFRNSKGRNFGLNESKFLTL